MHSSTSSSETYENQYQTMASHNRWQIAAKTMLAGALIYLCVLLTYHALLFAVGAQQLNERMLDQIDFAPKTVDVPEGHKSVLFYGSSMVQAGFEPYEFDLALANEGIEVTSFNYGIGNLNPQFQSLMTRRIKDAILPSGQKLDLVLLEFNPFQTTKVRKQIGVVTQDQNEALLSSVPELVQLTLQDPTKGVRLFNIRYLRYGISAELLSSAAQFVSLPSQDPEYLKADKNRDDARAAYYAHDSAVAPVYGRFNEPLRGGRIDKRKLSDQAANDLEVLVQSNQHPLFMQRDLQRRIDTSDILQLEFDETLIQDFLTMIENLKSVSHHLEVVLLPRNTDWVTYSPQAQERFDGVIERIKKQGNVTVLDTQEIPVISPKDFVDTTHLSYGRGITAYSRYLARHYAALLTDTQQLAD